MSVRRKGRGVRRYDIMPPHASRLVLLFLLSSFFFLLSSALAQESETTRQLESEIQEYQQLLEQQRQEEARLEAALAQTEADIRAQIAARDRVSQQIVDLHGAQAALLAEIEAKNTALAQTETRIEEANATLEHLKERMQGLLVRLYKQRSGRYARVLAQAESFHDLQVKNYYLSLITDQEIDLITEIDRTLAELAAAQTELTAILDALHVKEVELAANEQQLVATQANLATIIAKLEQTQAGQDAARLAAIRAQQTLSSSIGGAQAALQAEIQRLVELAEAQRRAAAAAVEARERQRLNELAQETERTAEALAAPLPPAESDFIYPVANPSLVTPYGSNGTHTYIELRAEQAGAPVRAVMSGKVIQARFFNANSGYLVSLLHGNGLVTIYQNLQRPLVSVGEQVNQGQVIGYLGGGALIRPDDLPFWMGVAQGTSTQWIDPASRLGF